MSIKKNIEYFSWFKGPQGPPGESASMVTNYPSIKNHTDGQIDFYNENKGSIMSHGLYGADGSWYIRGSTDNGKVILQDKNVGNVGIGKDDPVEKLDVNGNIKASNDIISGDVGTRLSSNSLILGDNIPDARYRINTGNHNLSFSKFDGVNWKPKFQIGNKGVTIDESTLTVKGKPGPSENTIMNDYGKSILGLIGKDGSIIGLGKNKGDIRDPDGWILSGDEKFQINRMGRSPTTYFQISEDGIIDVDKIRIGGKWIIQQEGDNMIIINSEKNNKYTFQSNGSMNFGS